MQTVDFETARVELIGAVIHQAVVDCFSQYKPTRDDARDFIFSNRICFFVRRFHLDEFINVNFIRAKVLEGRDACYLRITQGGEGTSLGYQRNQGCEAINKKGAYHARKKRNRKCQRRESCGDAEQVRTLRPAVDFATKTWK
jgi:hypothetical protein